MNEIYLNFSTQDEYAACMTAVLSRAVDSKEDKKAFKKDDYSLLCLG